MKIIREAMEHHIREVTEGYFLHPRDGFPEDFSIFDEYIEEMVESARHYGHTDILKPGIEYLLGHPELDLQPYGSSENWVWNNDEVRALLFYVRDRLWPDAGPLPDGGPPGVELVPAPGPEWNYSMPAVLPED